MIQVRREEAIEIAPYRDEDEEAVVALLEETMQESPIGAWSSSFFRWKHVRNPFGRSQILVARVADRLVGLRAFMRWRFHAGDRTLAAVRAVDTVTHPEYQGRGIFSRLTRGALAELGDGVDLVFNTPNDKSRPGYLKMGWTLVGVVPISIRVRHPVRFARGLRSLDDRTFPHTATPPIDAETASEALADENAVAALLSSQRDGPRLRTPRDASYLRWRYGGSHGLDYRAARYASGDGLRGLAIFRVRPRGRLWESTLAELIVEREDRGLARRLLREVVAAAPVDHVAGHATVGSAGGAAMRALGFLRAPRGPTLAVNVRREDLHPDPTDLRSWDLSLGDLEVF